jgi:hypothetical protein
MLCENTKKKVGEDERLTADIAGDKHILECSDVGVRELATVHGVGTQAEVDVVSYLSDISQRIQNWIR